MVLYIVGDFITKEEKINYSGELERMLEYAPHDKEIIVMSPEGNTPQGEFVNPSPGDLIYFGHSGKSIEHIQGGEHGLIQELPRYQEMFKRLKGLTFANPEELLLDNMSKDYLVRLSGESGIPTIESQRVNSLEDLMNTEDLFVKPLISERAAGAHRLNTLSDDKKNELFQQYVTEGCEGQGLILQPFIPGILDSGERKVGVIGGEITLCRLVNPNGTYTRASVSDSEKEVCERAWEYMKSNFPEIVYARVDLIGSPKKPVINEIEAVNPNLTTRHGKTPYDTGEVKNHYTLLFEKLLK